MVIPLPQLVKISHPVHTIYNDPSQVIELYYSAITTAKSVIHALVLPTTVVVGFCLLMLFPMLLLLKQFIQLHMCVRCFDAEQQEHRLVS